MIGFKQWNVSVVPSNVRRDPSRIYIEIITRTFVFKDFFIKTKQFPIPAALL